VSLQICKVVVVVVLVVVVVVADDDDNTVVEYSGALYTAKSVIK